MAQLVLVVDDEPAFLHILDVILSRAGYTVATAATGQQGLSMAYQLRPNAIILDDMMPDLTGGEVCMRLKADPDLRRIPVIMYSAGSRITSPAYIERIGAQFVLQKPSLPSEIVGAVSTLAGAGV